MQGTILQIIVLVIHGTAYLQGVPLEKDFLNKNMAFSFCEYVKFVDLNQDQPGEEAHFADNPIEWLHKLKGDGYTNLRIIYVSSDNQEISDRMTVGFIGGGGRWLIEAQGKNTSDYWEARWEVGDQNHPQKLIWQVTYGRVGSQLPPSNLQLRSAEEIKSELNIVLAEIASFAKKEKLDGFIEYFEKGIEVLGSSTPLDDVKATYLAPPQYLGLDSQQLLAVSQAAWVFGGMGSWNDFWFEGDAQKEYEKLSDQLFSLLNESYLTAVNSMATSPPIDTSAWWKFW